jgi:hypothetical protein
MTFSIIWAFDISAGSTTYETASLHIHGSGLCIEFVMPIEVIGFVRK